MKRILLALLLLPSLCFGAAYDVGIDQRPAANNVWEKRLLVSPVTTGIMSYNPATLLPVWLTLGAGMQVSSGVLNSVPTAWSAVAGKPDFATVATSGNYSDLVGIPATFAPEAHTQPWSTITSTPTTIAGYGLIDAASLSQLATKFDNPSGTTAQYLRGDGSTATFPSIPAAQVNSDWNSVSGVSQILNKPTIPSAQVQSDWNAVSGLGVILNKPALATVATSGAYADLTGKPTIPAAQVNTDWNSVSGVSQLLNKPTLATVATSGAYADLTGKPTIPAAQVNSDWNSVSGVSQILNKPTLTNGTVTSVTAGTGLSGGVITTTGTISLPNTGTAGTYSGVTTDAQGRVTAGTNRSQASATRSLNTAFQVSATQDSWVSYSVQITVTASIGGGQNGDVILEIATNSGFTTGVQTLSITGTGQTYTLAIALQGVQPQTGVVSGFVPAGYYARLRTVNNAGTPAFSYRAGQEALF